MLKTFFILKAGYESLYLKAGILQRDISITKTIPILLGQHS
jgi:hypothetical protein